MENFDLSAFLKKWQEKAETSGAALQERGEAYGGHYVDLSREEFMKTMKEFIHFTKQEWGGRYPANKDVLRAFRRNEIDEEKAFEILWAWNFPYLVKLAGKYPSGSLEILVSSTYQRFRDAMVRYEEEKNDSFLAFLTPYVEGAMLDEIRKTRKYEDHYTCSLNNPLDGGMEVIDYETDDRPDPSSLIEKEDYQSWVKDLSRKALREARLTRKQARVIDMIYFQDLKPQKVAAILQIDPTSVRDAHQGAMKKLRKYLLSHKEGI